MRALTHRAPLGDRGLARGVEAGGILGEFLRRRGERGGEGAAHGGGAGRPRRDRRVERIAVRDVDRAVGERDRADLAHEGVVVARDQVELDAAREADVLEAHELERRVGLEGRVVELGDVAVHDDAVEVLEQRLEGIRAASAAGPAEMQVAEDKCAWNACGAHAGLAPEEGTVP